MQVRLEHIGIIKDSIIDLDGLTVITGKNGSGKTTVGKAIYSLFDGVCDLYRRSRNDKTRYMVERVNGLRNSSFIFFIIRELSHRDESFESSYPNISQISKLHYVNISDFDNACNLILVIIDEFKSFKDYLHNVDIIDNSWIKHLVKLDSDSNNVDEGVYEHIEKLIDDIINHLNRVLDAVYADPELIDYAFESINLTLNMEFSGQIQPINGEYEESHILVYDKNTTYFDVPIVKDEVLKTESRVYYGTPFDSVYFIDDPCVLDDDYMGGRFYRNHDDSISLDIVSHKENLRRSIKSNLGMSVFEKTVLNDTLKRVVNILNDDIPGSFEFNDQGCFYIENGRKLNFSNLAAGAKMFSIFKILINRGLLDNTSLLILDEPEAHLHPMWQNKLAEVIVLLVKTLGVHVILSTHSPNFMLALDANMRKYRIEDKTHYYQTVMDNDGFVDYQSVDDDISLIYEDFAEYFAEAHALLQKYQNSYDNEVDSND